MELRSIWRNQKALPLLKVRTWQDEVSERLEEYLRKRMNELREPEKDAVQSKKCTKENSKYLAKRDPVRTHRGRILR